MEGERERMKRREGENKGRGDGLKIPVLRVHLRRIRRIMKSRIW